jgi:hypothetical protein
MIHNIVLYMKYEMFWNLSHLWYRFYFLISALCLSVCQFQLLASEWASLASENYLPCFRTLADLIWLTVPQEKWHDIMI